MYTAKLDEVRVHLERLKNNSNSKSITVEKLWGAIFVISGIVEELNKAFSVLQDSSQIMDDLKTLSQNIDSMASEDFNDQAYQDLIETSLQNVAKLAQAIQKHQNYQIISSHQAPSLSSKNMMPIIPDEIYAEVIANVLDQCRTIGELLRNINAISRLNKRSLRLIMEHHIVKNKFDEVKKRRDFSWKISGNLSLLDSSFLPVFCQNPMYSSKFDLRLLIDLAVYQEKYEVLKKIISACKLRGKQNGLAGCDGLFDACLVMLFKKLNIKTKESPDLSELQETGIIGLILSVKPPIFNQSFVDQLGAAEKRMILSRTKTDNWDVAISEKMALSVLSYDFISISGQNVQSTSGKLNIGFQMRMIASFEMLQKLLNNKVISDSNCLVFIDKFLAFPSWSKYRDSKDRPRGVGCEILMNLSNMPTALEKMDRSRLVKALAIAIQAEHARVITFFIERLIALSEGELSYLSNFLEKFDKANLVKHLVAAIEARNFQEIALFSGVLCFVFKDGSAKEVEYLACEFKKINGDSMSAAINFVLDEAGPSAIEFLLNHFLSQSSSFQDRKQMMSVFYGKNCDRLKILRKAQYNLQFLVQLEYLSPHDGSGLMSGLVKDFINFAQNRLTVSPKQLFQAWVFSYQENNSVDLFAVLNTRRNPQNYFSVTYKEIFDNYCVGLMVDSEPEVVNDNANTLSS